LSGAFMRKRAYYIVNSITAYRLIMAPVLIILAICDQFEWFKWLLPISFFTDLIDGTLARFFKVTSVFGTKLDSVADDLTIVAGIVGLFVFKPDFIKEEIYLVSAILILYVVQNIAAIIRYRKMSSFHTYAAKFAALVQGIFLILTFFLPEPLYFLFYTVVIVSALDLIEETVLVFLLPKWKANVKGLYWVLKHKSGLLRK